MGIPVATITSGSATLDPEIELLTLEVRRAVNKVPEATLTLLDGSMASRKFEVSNLSFFEPGKLVKIAMRYEGDPQDTAIFEGLVVRHAVSNTGEGSTLRVELKDAAVKLTRTRRTFVHRDGTDADAMSAAITAGGASVGTVAPTTPTYPELVQFNATDWDFLLSRADVLGMVVTAHMGAVSVGKPTLGGPKRDLSPGLDDVSEFSLEIDAAQQWADVKAQGWDLQKLTPTPAEAATDPGISAGNLDPAAIARLVGGASMGLVHPATFQPNELKAWADARLLRSRLSFLRGRAVVTGNAALAPLDTVRILGVGDRFNGSALVTGVTHTVDENGWQTELQIGLSPEWFARTPDIADVPAGGLLPPVRGLQVGVVGAIDPDPTKELRLQVKLSALGDALLWARLLSPDAGPNRGFVFRPEVGDEVLVGFLDEDPRQPVVLGALFSAKNTTPKPVDAPDAENNLRAIVSRSGARIVFDDKTPSLTIETQSGGDYKNRVVIDDAAKSIIISDQHGNKLTMDQNGIVLKSAKDLTLEGAGNVVIKGTAVDVQ